MKLVFNDPTFSFEVVRAISYSVYGGADIGEVLSTAYKIEEGNFEQWHTEWYKTAERIHGLALEALKKDNRISAKQFFMRASNYYRTAEFFLHGNPEDPRILETWGKSRSTFRQALQWDTNVEEVKIPYEGTNLPGYFYRVDDKKRPVLVVHGGYDSTQEELYLEIVVAALERGYHCLTFEGPGQGAVIREQKLPFRHDWEKVVTPVIDYVLMRPEVDPDRIVLKGISLGGLLAPRAAAFEHRIAALVANDGLFSFQFRKMGEAIQKTIPGANGDMNDPVYAANFMKSIMEKNAAVRWALENGMFTFGTSSLVELVEMTEAYTLEGVADKIKCPTLVCEAEEDHAFKGQPQLLMNALTCPTTHMKFTVEEGAEEHCQFGGLLLFNHRLFEWLDETLKVKKA